MFNIFKQAGLLVVGQGGHYLFELHHVNEDMGHVAQINGLKKEESRALSAHHVP